MIAGNIKLSLGIDIVIRDNNLSLIKFLTKSKLSKTKEDIIIKKS